MPSQHVTGAASWYEPPELPEMYEHDLIDDCISGLQEALSMFDSDDIAQQVREAVSHLKPIYLDDEFRAEATRIAKEEGFE